MPIIIIRDYVWSQTDCTIVIYIPLKGVHSSKVNIFFTEDYVKAHFPPFLFEVFLRSPVDEAESVCTVAEGQVVFQLRKKESGLWDSLQVQLSKAEMVQLRQKAVERAQEVAQDRSKQNAGRKDQLQKLSVRQQIQLDSDERTHIESLKQQATSSALQQWKTSNEVASRQAAGGSSHHQAGSSTFAENAHKEKDVVDLRNRNTQQTRDGELKMESTFAGEIFELAEDRCMPVPLPRHPGSIAVNFTTRVFPTPCRESQAEEEQIWLKKQAEARRQVGFVVEDLRPEEHDPVWLKEKGDSFFRAGNYLGAVSAYSHAIKLGSKMPELYSNRAAAHLSLNNLHKTLEDCTQALELLVPAVSLNALQRARCHARRGSALCRLGMPAQGLVDMKIALSLRPGDQQLQDDIEKAQALVDSLPSESDSDELLT